MPKNLQKEIVEHLTTFPARLKDVQEMQQEWKDYQRGAESFRRQAFYVLLGFVGTFIAIGMWVGTIQTNIENVMQEHNKLDSQTESIVARVGTLEVNNSEIRSRLTSIEVTLQEIKAAIIKLQ